MRSQFEFLVREWPDVFAAADIRRAADDPIQIDVLMQSLDAVRATAIAA